MKIDRYPLYENSNQIKCIMETRCGLLPVIFLLMQHIVITGNKFLTFRTARIILKLRLIEFL